MSSEHDQKTADIRSKIESLQNEIKACEEMLLDLRGQLKREQGALADLAIEEIRNLAKLAGLNDEALANKLGLSIKGGPTIKEPRAARGTAGPKKTVGEPKYRNPDNPEQTWTGKGRAPAWFVEYAGDKSDLLIKQESSAEQQ